MDKLIAEYSKVTDELLEAEKKLLIYEKVCGRVINGIVEKIYREHNEEVQKRRTEGKY